MFRAPRRPLLVALSLALGLWASGCQAKRTLVVTSEPTGAEVRLDGHNWGPTPVTIEFLHYGVRRVSLYLPGHVSHSRVIEMKPPWYGRFPLDLFSEVIVPVGWRDRHTVHAVLEPGQSVITAPELESVIQRSEELRRAGPEGPVPVKPPVVATREEGGGS